MSYPSVPRFERDDGDEIPGTRPRGRVVPMQPEEPGLLIDIRVNGVTFGTIDPTQLKAKAQIDLERTMTALGLLRWCEQYGGVDNSDLTRDERTGKTDLDRLEDELAEMPLYSIVELAQSISAALGEAMQIPKQRRRT